MNENIDLTKILKDCPKGTKLWHTVYGEVRFNNIMDNIEGDKPYIVFFTRGNNCIHSVTTDGRMYEKYDGECVLFPSKEQRDWSKFVPTWETKKDVVKVTIHPFDKVLVRVCSEHHWLAQIVTFITDEGIETADGNSWCDGIPYNEDTAHLLYTTDDCPINYEIEFSKEFKE